MNARAEDLKWNGSEGHMTWNTDPENLNWLSGGNQVAYTNDSYVKFEDNGSGVVTLVGELVSKGVKVDNSAGCDYTFTGEGTITGDFCRLTKRGAGTLTINTANSFYETKLERGKLVLGNAGALGSKEVHLYGGTLDLNNQTIGNQVYVDNDASIGNGTLKDSATVTAGATTITALNEETPGLLQALSVSDGLIAGTDRHSSLADGLYIKSESDLLIESMTITANNEIYVGENTITLKGVTIKLSEDDCTGKDPLDGVYYFNLSDLFHCDVVFDASELELPSGFDPSMDALGIDFGDKVNITETDGMYLHMGGEWSQTMSIDEQGHPVFTKLIPTPEPTTGTLGMLALAAIAARRRK